MYIFTDGSCIGNPGKGASGIFINCTQRIPLPKIGYIINNIIDFSSQYNIFLNFSNFTTSNIEEMNAVLLAFRYLDYSNIQKVDIYTDSQYVANGYNNWMHNWIKKEWKTTHNHIIANLLLWQELYNYYNKYKNVKVIWIRSHTNNKDFFSTSNAVIDKAVQNYARSFK